MPHDRPLTAPERLQLIDRWYAPHHDGLTDSIDAAIARHGHARVIDAHSFQDTHLDVRWGTDAFHVTGDERETPEKLERP